MQLDILARQYIQLRDAHVDEVPAEVSSLRSWLDNVFVTDARSVLAADPLLSSGAGSLFPLGCLPDGEE